MPIILENSDVRLSIDPCGAQLCGLVDKATGQEQLWQPTQGIWDDSAPWLFPLIGQLRDGSFSWKGRCYHLPMHGFAGKAAFSPEKCSDTLAVFSLEDSADTLKVYPWRFRLEITCWLEGKKACVRATVTNRDREKMYFSLGAHPGLRCAPGDTLTLNNQEPLPVYRLNQDTHLLHTTMADMLPERAALQLEEGLFDADAMLLRNGNVTRLCLHRQQGKDICFTCQGTPWLGLWSRKGAGLPYICIEPWYGVDDPEDACPEIEKKLDVLCLQPGEQFTMSYTMEISDGEEREE